MQYIVDKYHLHNISLSCPCMFANNSSIEKFSKKVFGCCQAIKDVVEMEPPGWTTITTGPSSIYIYIYKLWNFAGWDVENSQVLLVDNLLLDCLASSTGLVECLIRFLSSNNHSKFDSILPSSLNKIS